MEGRGKRRRMKEEEMERKKEKNRKRFIEFSWIRSNATASCTEFISVLINL